MDDRERKIADGALYFLSIDASWCFIRKHYKMKEEDIRRLVCLRKSELTLGEKTTK